jgi:hypothetical protein
VSHNQLSEAIEYPDKFLVTEEDDEDYIDEGG